MKTPRPIATTLRAVPFALFAFAAAPAMPAAALSQNEIQALAQNHIKTIEPKLDTNSADALDAFRFLLNSQKNTPLFLDETIGEQVSLLTAALAAQKSRDALLAAASELVILRPGNVRVLNLQAAVLHERDNFGACALVLEYALSLAPKNLTLQLNLANNYLDLDRDTEAKKLLDRLETDDPENKSVYLALATYWHKNGNKSLAEEYKVKASEIIALCGVRRRAAQKVMEQVDENTVEMDESVEEMESKVDELAKSVPLTTADIIENDFPDAARQIREKYTTLRAPERLVLPALPMLNLNDPQAFRLNAPHAAAWGEAIVRQFAGSWAGSMGVNINAPEAVRERQTKAAAKKQMETQLRQARDMLRQLQGSSMPGLQQADMDRALGQIEAEAAKHGIALGGAPSAQSESTMTGDSGRLFGHENHINYLKIRRSHDFYLKAYFDDYELRQQDIFNVYGRKCTEENLYNARQKEEHNKKEHKDVITGNYDPDHINYNCIKCLEEDIRHRKKLNEHADGHYKQWRELYMMQYRNRMKPVLENYYSVGLLYIKNMRSQEEAENACRELLQTLMIYGTKAATGLLAGGGFKYMGPTDEEEKRLLELLRQAEADAKESKEKYQREASPPEFDAVAWFAQNFSIGVSTPFLGFRITAHSIEITAHVIAVGGGAKYDWGKDQFSTNIGVGVKAEIGGEFMGQSAKVGASVDSWRRTATWNTQNGKYQETDSAGASLKGKLGSASLNVKGELNSELVSKVSATAGYGNASFNLGETSFQW